MDISAYMTASEVKKRLAKREIGVKELLSFYLDRIARLDGADGLDSVAELDERALAAAAEMDSLKTVPDLPLWGLPVLVKDNIDVKGLHTTAGSLALSDNTAADDAPVIASLRRNGAVIIGKTNMTEFANYTTRGMPGGYSSRGGQVRHAYDPKKSPSGSSSGSAVAVSAGLCAMAVGTDTSFSVIACATENGISGLKPPVGRLSQQGIIPIAHTLDSAGALTRSFTDALLLYEGMGGLRESEIPSALPGRLRIAVNTFNSELVSEAQKEKYSALRERMERDGTVFTFIEQPYTPCLAEVMRCEFAHDLGVYLSGSASRFSSLAEIAGFYRADPTVRMKYGISLIEGALSASGRLDDGVYLEALAERERLRRKIQSELKDFDACIMTGPTNIMHFTGLPSVALTLCMGDDGIPRGVILYGADEKRLYSAARTVEKYCLPVLPPCPEKLYPLKKTNSEVS